MFLGDGDAFGVVGNSLLDAVRLDYCHVNDNGAFPTLSPFVYQIFFSGSYPLFVLSLAGSVAFK